MQKRIRVLVVIVCLIGVWFFFRRTPPAPDTDLLFSHSPPPSVRMDANRNLIVPVDPCATVTPEADYRVYIGYGDVVAGQNYSDVVGGQNYIEGYKDIVGHIQALRGVYRPAWAVGDLTRIPPNEVTVVFEPIGTCVTPMPPNAP